jgi:tRNA(Ile)-lysidine synthase
MTQKKTPLPDRFKQRHILSGLEACEPILVGFSGGADSSALLHMLSIYARENGATVYAAHVNHGIRGAEADRDERFCKELAQRLGVRFSSLRIDVPAIAKNTGESIETAARRERYEYFDRLMHENNIKLLATAHNADDNLETVIFNIARGSALGGVCGIPDKRPCKHGTVIRPILGMEKSEIIAYCKDNGLDFVTDSTNTDTDYTRNKIRAQIIPVMRQINSGAVKNASRMSELLREDAVCLDDLTDNFISEHCKGYSIDAKKLTEAPSSIACRALIRLYDKFSGGESLEQVHVSSLRELAKNAVPHSRASLPAGIEGVIENERLCFTKRSAETFEVEDYSIELCDGENKIPQTNCEIFIGEPNNSKIIYKKSILTSIDSAKIDGVLIARPRHSGDKIKMGGMSKSVKKLMCDKKIPLKLRSRIPVICDASGIIAIPFIGVRDGAVYKEGRSAPKFKKDVIFYLD